MSHGPDIDKIYLYAKYSNEIKHQLLINKSEKVGLKPCNDSKAFIEQLIDMGIFMKKLKNTTRIKNAKH